MIRLPVFERLCVNSYRLFPGTEDSPGIDFNFQPGLSVIAGINGLGKTTLINVLFRLVVGPFELPKIDTAGRFSAKARVEETAWMQARQFFPQRVADRAEDAIASLNFRIGDRSFYVQRALSDCRLLCASVDKEPITVNDRSESFYKDLVTECAGVGSFADFLMLVKFLTFFNEDRRDILWDDKAQRQFLRILFVPPHMSRAWVRFEEQITSADSGARNASAFAHGIEKQISELVGALERSAGVTAELDVAQSLLDADLQLQASLEERAEKLRHAQLSLARTIERAKLAEDAMRRELEEIRYTSLGRLFPTLDETARYILTHLFANAKCLACGAEVPDGVSRLNHAISEGICAICGSPPSIQARPSVSKEVVPVHELEQKKIERARERVSNARIECEASEREEALCREQLASVNGQLDDVSRSIDARRLANETLRARLPPDPKQIADKRKALEDARITEKHYRRERLNFEREYKVLLDQTEEMIRQAAVAVAGHFERFAPAFLEEDCSISFRMVRGRPSQGGEFFMYPALKFEMSAAAFETPQPRDSPDDVSESQREFVDLAFRMALMAAASDDGAATLVIETPEASLDVIFMKKAGRMLRAFAEQSGRRVIVTSNLTSAAMIPALLGGDGGDPREVASRESRVLDLVAIAAPNAAIRKFGAEYRALLSESMRGTLS